MKDAQFNYWDEAVRTSAEENGVTLTDDQAKAMAADMQSCHENYGLAFYQPPASESPILRELKETKEALRKEQSKVMCKECKGGGRIYTQGPYHGYDSECWKCRGEGRILP